MRLRLLIFMLICIPVSSLLAGNAGTVSFDSTFKQFPGVVDWSPVYGMDGDKLFSRVAFFDTVANKPDTLSGYFQGSKFIANKRVLFPDYLWDSLSISFENYAGKMCKLSNGFYFGSAPSKMYLSDVETDKSICYNFDTDSSYFVDRVVYFKSASLDPDRTYPAYITNYFIKSPKGELFAAARILTSSKPLLFMLKDNKDWVQASDFLDCNYKYFYDLCSDNSGIINYGNLGGVIIRNNFDLTIDTLLKRGEVDFVSDPLYNPKPFFWLPKILRYDAKADILYGLNSARELIYYKDNKWTFDTTFYLHHKFPERDFIDDILIDTNSNMYLLYEEWNYENVDSLYIRYADGTCSAVSIPMGYERMFFDDKGKIWITGSKGEYLGKAVVYDPYSQTTSVEEYASYLPTLHPKEVFPNPASGKVTAKFWGINRYVNSMNVGLYNSNGVKLKDLDEYVVYDKSTEKGSIEFSVSDLPSGVYYLLYTAKEIKKLQGLIINR